LTSESGEDVEPALSVPVTVGGHLDLARQLANHVDGEVSLQNGERPA
jgi:hypothetical protein